MSIGRKITSLFILAIAIISFNSLATAQDTTEKTDKNNVERRERKNRFGGEGKSGKFGKHGKRGGHGMMRGLHKLDLTEDQKAQIKTMAETQHTANQPLREEAHTLMLKKRDGIITEAETARLGEIKNQMKNSAEQLKNSVMAILTPEQLQKLEEMKAEKQRKMEERRQLREQRRQEKSEQPTKTEDN